MVTVHVRDQHPLDVPYRRADGGEAPLQGDPALVTIPAGVDQHDASAVLDGVGVDGAEAVAGERKRDPVHAPGHRMGTGLGPGSAARAFLRSQGRAPRHRSAVRHPEPRRTQGSTTQ